MNEKFKINQFCYDSENKEFVKISNGIERDGEFIPTEAIAFRLTGLNVNKPVIGFTYRKVNAERLHIIEDGGHYESILNSNKPEHFIFIGRI